MVTSCVVQEGTVSTRLLSRAIAPVPRIRLKKVETMLSAATKAPIVNRKGLTHKDDEMRLLLGSGQLMWC